MAVIRRTEINRVEMLDLSSRRMLFSETKRERKFLCGKCRTPHSKVEDAEVCYSLCVSSRKRK